MLPCTVFVGTCRKENVLTLMACLPCFAAPDFGRLVASWTLSIMLKLLSSMLPGSLLLYCSPSKKESMSMEKLDQLAREPLKFLPEIPDNPSGAPPSDCIAEKKEKRERERESKTVRERKRQARPKRAKKPLKMPPKNLSEAIKKQVQFWTLL